jgi:hypothetical protein
VWRDYSFWPGLGFEFRARVSSPPCIIWFGAKYTGSRRHLLYCVMEYFVRTVDLLKLRLELYTALYTVTATTRVWPGQARPGQATGSTTLNRNCGMEYFYYQLVRSSSDSSILDN